jgi:putative membrane protein
MMWGCNYFPFAGGWSGGYFPGGIFSLLIWGLVVGLIVYLVVRLIKTQTHPSNGSSQDRTDSLSILKSRYARGEISQEEFIKMKQLLMEP